MPNSISKLLERKWMSFQYDQLFDIVHGSNVRVSSIVKNGITPLISALKDRNGLTGFVDLDPQFDGNAIVVNNNGNAGVGVAFYQPLPFCATVDVNVLKPKFVLNEKRAMFLISLIRKERFRYSFGRKWRVNRMNKSIIKLPVDDNGKPDWKFMEDYIDNIENTVFSKIGISEKAIHDKQLKLFERKWKDFVYTELFEIKKGKRVIVDEIMDEQGKFNFVSAIDSNNGVFCKTNLEPNQSANVLTVNYDGNGVADAFYQDQPFWALDSVNVLYPKFRLNCFIAMFLITLIRKEKYRFNYGRKWHKERMEKSIIKLPVDDNGKPDWKFMEDYIKSLPYSSNLQN